MFVNIRLAKIQTLGMLAVLLFMIGLVGGVAKADETTKAPEGSKDRAIDEAAYCMGQAQTRALKLKEFLSQNPQSGAPVVYLSNKLLLLSSEMSWMYGMVSALGKRVENPNPQILTTGLNQGKVDGLVFFDIEDKCRLECASAQSADIMASCVDACTDKADPTNRAKDCDKRYLTLTKK